ncbi:MAG: NAD(P)-binding domain-containing protein [Schleiferiaceae bacterium]|nr:NAD(P)-binding domain-containing protein [Schleiferiaceae bacterium]
MKKVLFIDSVHPLVEKELAKKGFQVEHDYSSSKEEIAKILNQYEGLIIRSRFKIDQEFLSHPHQLNFIGRYGAGLENIDTAFAEQQKITCIRVPEGNADAVGEQAIGMLLMLFNNLKRADQEIRNGIWKREENRGYELSGKTVGIIGAGHMGSRMIRKLQGFDCQILVYDKYKRMDEVGFVQVELNEIFKRADIVSIHTPLTEETDNWMNENFWNQFYKPIYFINTARGPIVNTKSLIDAIDQGKISGACLDVLEYEKTSFENLFENKELPEAFQRLIASEKVILSPHIAGWSFESYVKLGTTMVDKILALY